MKGRPLSLCSIFTVQSQTAGWVSSPASGWIWDACLHKAVGRENTRWKSQTWLGQSSLWSQRSASKWLGLGFFSPSGAISDPSLSPSVVTRLERTYFLVHTETLAHLWPFGLSLWTSDSPSLGLTPQIPGFILLEVLTQSQPWEALTNHDRVHFIPCSWVSNCIKTQRDSLLMMVLYAQWRRQLPKNLGEAGPAKSESHSVTSSSLWSHGLQPARLLCPWDSPGKNTGLGCQDLPTQGWNPGLLHCRQILYHPSHQGSPMAVKTYSLRGPTDRTELGLGSRHHLCDACLPLPQHFISITSLYGNDLLNLYVCGYKK